MSDLAGRKALVTGSGHGIGLGIARTLAEHGAAVAVNDIDPGRAAAAVATLKDAGGNAIAVPADVASADDVRRMVAAAQDAFGRIDILVNNAGIYPLKPFLEYSEEEWDRILATNLKSVFLCCREVLPGMIEHGQGNIVNIASIAAFHFTTEHAPYAASKAGVVALTLNLAYEMAPRGVRVNAIAPGPVAVREGMAGLATPVGRPGTPADIGGAVAYLVSDAAAYVTGVTLPVAGGANLRVSMS